MASTMTLQSTLPLPNNPNRIPALGFGVYQSPTNVCINSCLTALRSGYRHIDSAQFYANETEVGHAVQQFLQESGGKVKREDIYLTTKIMSAASDVDSTYEKIIDSVIKMSGGDKDGYVDLFLIHTPSGGSEKRKIMWNALERAYKEGRCKAIGVSNFGVGHIEEMKSYQTAVWPPHVNQIELHPWNQQREIDAYCQKNGIVVEAYCPIVRNQKASDPTVSSIAEAHNVTPNQVLIRYCLQKNWVPLPKSDTPARIAANADLYSFELSREEMEKMDALDQGPRGAIVQAVKNDSV